MHHLSSILTDLQAAIAARAARDRALTLLLVAVWGRIARMRTRLERLIALWRAGKLPAPRPSCAGRTSTAPRSPRMKFPTAPAWLIARVRDAVPFGTQLEHMLTDEECAAFLAAVPQAGRILRPLFHMLGVSPMPAAVRRQAPMPAYPRPDAMVAATDIVIASGPLLNFSRA